MLLADASASQDVTRAARDVLKRIDAQLAEGGSLYNTFKNVETFSETLANNSKRIDNILAGLENLSGGADGKRRYPGGGALAQDAGRQSRQAYG